MSKLRVEDLCLYAAAMARRRLEVNITDKEFEVLCLLYASSEDNKPIGASQLRHTTESTRHHLTRCANKGIVNLVKCNTGSKVCNMYNVSEDGLTKLRYILGIKE